MKVSVNWLKNYVDLKEKPEKIAELLTEHAFETVVLNNNPQVDLQNVFAGDVLEVNKHPNADRLSLAKVKVGTKTYSIVCGAPNVRLGLKVAVVFPGAKVLNKERQLAELEKAVIRGVASEGMICSERELGLGDAHDGIMELPSETKNNLTLDKLFTSNKILELDVLPDRAADCSSYYGVAREVAAIAGYKTKLPITTLSVQKKGKSGIKLEVENKNHCSRYIATEIIDIKNGLSPVWLQENLRAHGIKPQNLIVDVTNFVLWEIGQPLHAFDAAAIGRKLGVRQSKPGEKITTLDDIDRKLPEGTLIIASDDKPVAIAGVIGGKESAVKADTSRIVLEAALFAPTLVRKFVNATNLRTDASDRFTRGLTVDHVAAGANRAIGLLVKYGQGKVLAQQEFYGKKEAARVIEVSHEKIEQVLGLEVKKSVVTKLLLRLGFGLSAGKNKYRVRAPLFRRDITIPEDVIEEVGRMVGYNNIAANLPTAPLAPAILPDKMKEIRKIQDTLKGAGWLEAYLYSVVPDKIVDALALDETEKPLMLQNPMRADAKSLRASLLPNLLGLAEAGVKKEPQSRIFEVGHVYPPKGMEHTCAAGVLLRRGEPGEKDFYEIKGLVELLLAELNIRNLFFKKVASGVFDENISAAIFAGNVQIGILGQVAADILKKLNVRGAVTAFELDLNYLGEVTRLEKVYNPPLPYPTVQRDVTLILSEDVLVDLVQEKIADAGGKLVQDVDFVDQYDDGKQRSITLRVIYGSAEKTLTDGEVNSLHKKVLQQVSEKLGVKEKV